MARLSKTIIGSRRALAVLAAASLLASCSGAGHNSVTPSVAAPGIQPMYLDQNQTEGGGCAGGYEIDQNPADSTYGQCVPLKTISSEYVPCGMTCQAWWGNGDPSLYNLVYYYPPVAYDGGSGPFYGSNPYYGQCEDLPGGDTSLDSFGDTANNLILNDAWLASLAAYLFSIGALPTFNIGTNADGAIARDNYSSFTSPYNSSITWDVSQFNSSQQNPYQVLFHEFDHFFYELGSMNPNNPGIPTSATATIGGVTYTFDFTPVTNADGSLGESDGYQAYEHILIHNDLVSRYGSDLTGSLLEALGHASNPPSNLTDTTQANVTATATVSWPRAGPPSNDNCSNIFAASVGRRSESVSGRGQGFKPREFSLRYKFIHRHRKG